MTINILVFFGSRCRYSVCSRKLTGSQLGHPHSITQSSASAEEPSAEEPCEHTVI